jgi:hypothetical protein
VRSALAGGEIGVSALTERAEKVRHLKRGHTLVFKSHAEPIPYVEAAEAVSLTFAGKEVIAH